MALSPEAAVAYVKAEWQDFLGLYPKILDEQHRAALLAQDAAERGDVLGHDEAIDTIRRLGELAQLHNRAVSDYERVAGFFGLGAVPIAYATAIVALAALVVYIFARYNALVRILDLVEAGDLSPGDAEAILAQGPKNPLDSAVSLAGIGAAVALLYVVSQLVHR